MTDSSHWPRLGESVRVGLVGELLSMLKGRTEADPAAVLFEFLSAYGNAVGTNPRFYLTASDAEHVVHRPLLYVVKVGDSSKSRKGSASKIVQAIMQAADSDWPQRVKTGHASGEALMRDLAPGDDGYRPAPELFVREPEFSRFLKSANRDGSILSEVTRAAWDGDSLQNRKVSGKGPVVVDTHHVSIVGDVTRDELMSVMPSVELMNGFGNRFLWVATRRQMRLPQGDQFTRAQLDHLAQLVSDSLGRARSVGPIRRDDAAIDRWQAWYLTRPEHEGLLAAATARDEANTLRLSMIFALLDGSSTIRLEHQKAAETCWQYAEDSAAMLFANATGHQDVDLLMSRMTPAGLDRTAQHNLFGGRSQRAQHARRMALDLGLVEEQVESQTGGRPRLTLVPVLARSISSFSSESGLIEVNELIESPGTGGQPPPCETCGEPPGIIGSDAIYHCHAQSWNL